MTTREVIAKLNDKQLKRLDWYKEELYEADDDLKKRNELRSCIRAYTKALSDSEILTEREAMQVFIYTTIHMKAE